MTGRQLTALMSHLQLRASDVASSCSSQGETEQRIREMMDGGRAVSDIVQRTIGPSMPPHLRSVA